MILRGVGHALHPRAKASASPRTTSLVVMRTSVQWLAGNYGEPVGRVRGSMITSLVEHLKKQSKQLLKAFRAGEQRAIERVRAVFHHAGTFSLMNAHHVIAKEYGFDNWNSLIAAPEAELRRALEPRSGVEDQVRAVLAEQPQLTVFGFRPPYGTGSGNVDSIRTPDEFRRKRDALLSTDGLEQVRAAVAFLEQLRPARIVARTSRTSYGLKHSAEEWHRKQGRGRYIGNGALIVAALIKGFSIKRVEVRSPNCLVGVNVREVKAPGEGIDPASLRVRPSPFVRWLFAQAGRDDAVGDLAGDAKDDLRFPRGGREEVEAYLVRYGHHIQEALAQASSEWSSSKGPSKSQRA